MSDSVGCLILLWWLIGAIPFVLYCYGINIYHRILYSRIGQSEKNQLLADVATIYKRKFSNDLERVGKIKFSVAYSKSWCCKKPVLLALVTINSVEGLSKGSLKKHWAYVSSDVMICSHCGNYGFFDSDDFFGPNNFRCMSNNVRESRH